MEILPRFSMQSLVLEVLERVGCLNFQTQAHLHRLPKCGIVCARESSCLCSELSLPPGPRGTSCRDWAWDRTNTSSVWDQKQQEIHRKKRKSNSLR